MCVCVCAMHLTLFNINIGGQVSQKGVRGRTDWSQTMNLYSYGYRTVRYSRKYEPEIKSETKTPQRKIWDNRYNNGKIVLGQ